MTYVLIISFDGDIFNETAQSTYSHENTRGLGNYLGNAFTTGCYHRGKTIKAIGESIIHGETGSRSDQRICNIKTEIFDLTKNSWSEIADYPHARDYDSGLDNNYE